MDQDLDLNPDLGLGLNNYIHNASIYSKVVCHSRAVYEMRMEFIDLADVTIYYRISMGF